MGLPKATDDPRFNEFWLAYPRKVDKGHARTAFKWALAKVRHDELLIAVTSFAMSVRDKEKQFIPYPATWLRGERWTDELSNPCTARTGETKLAPDKASQRAWYEAHGMHVPYRLR